MPEQSRVFRQFVTMEVIGLAQPGSDGSTDELMAGVDVEGIVRDAVQANDTGSKKVWLVAGESHVTKVEELTPDA